MDQATRTRSDVVSPTSRSRRKYKTEYELLDLGLFDGNRYFDVFVEYAQRRPPMMRWREPVSSTAVQTRPRYNYRRPLV